MIEYGCSSEEQRRPLTAHQETLQVDPLYQLYVLIKETQRRQYEGHNTPLGCYADQGP